MDDTFFLAIIKEKLCCWLYIGTFYRIFKVTWASHHPTDRFLRELIRVCWVGPTTTILKTGSLGSRCPFPPLLILHTAGDPWRMAIMRMGQGLTMVVGGTTRGRPILPHQIISRTAIQINVADLEGTVHHLIRADSTISTTKEMGTITTTITIE